MTAAPATWQEPSLFDGMDPGTRAFLRIVESIPAGRRFTVNDLRDRLDVAEIPAASRGGMFWTAVQAGLIEPVRLTEWGVKHDVFVRSTGSTAHGATVRLWRRLQPQTTPDPGGDVVSRRLVCLCGAGLVWVPYFRTPDEQPDLFADLTEERPHLRDPRPVLPFDRHPVYSPQPQWAKAEFALMFGNTRARRITRAAPVDLAVERAHTIHFATCDLHVTAEELGKWSSRKGRSKAKRPSRQRSGAHR